LNGNVHKTNQQARGKLQFQNEAGITDAGYNTRSPERFRGSIACATT